MCNEHMDKRNIYEAKIISNTRISKGIFQLIFVDREMADKAIPGQFINVYCNNQSLLLPRPISICEIDNIDGWVKIVYAVVGQGTKEMSKYVPGDTIRVLGPLGNGYSIDESEKSIVVAGGVGTPPMLELVKRLEGDIEVFLGFRTEPFLIKEIEKYALVHVATDDGSNGYKGTVIDLLNEFKPRGDILYACGPKPMLKAVQLWSSNHNIPTQLSLEERMGCGIGACVGCAVKIRDNSPNGWSNKKVCKDGPVFLGEEVMFDE